MTWMERTRDSGGGGGKAVKEAVSGARQKETTAVSRAVRLRGTVNMAAEAVGGRWHRPCQTKGFGFYSEASRRW